MISSSKFVLQLLDSLESDRMVRTSVTGIHPMKLPNGMNLRLSMQNPNSKARRILDYLRTNGPRSRVDIIRDVFGRTVDNRPRRVRDATGDIDKVQRGWSGGLFSLMQGHGLIRQVRKGRTVLYEAI